MIFLNASPPSGMKPEPFTYHIVAAWNKCSHSAPLSLQQNLEGKDDSSFSIELVSQKKKKEEST